MSFATRASPAYTTPWIIPPIFSAVPAAVVATPSALVVPALATGEIGNSKSKTRTSWSSMLRYSQSAIVDRIEHRAALVAVLPVENLERLNMVRYSPGKHFGGHHDGKFRERNVFMNLNDVPGGGGETFFRHLGFRFIPRRGAAVVWSNAAPDGTEDSRMVHRGLLPKSVVKFGVNCFFQFELSRQVLQPRV